MPQPLHLPGALPDQRLVCPGGHLNGLGLGALTILPTVTPRPVTRTIAQVLSIERAGGDFAAVRHLVAGSRAAGVRDRRLDAGIWSSGLAQGLIHHVPTVSGLVDRIIAEVTRVIVRMMTLSPATT